MEERPHARRYSAFRSRRAGPSRRPRAIAQCAVIETVFLPSVEIVVSALAFRGGNGTDRIVSDSVPVCAGFRFPYPATGRPACRLRDVSSTTPPLASTPGLPQGLSREPNRRSPIPPGFVLSFDPVAPMRNGAGRAEGGLPQPCLRFRASIGRRGSPFPARAGDSAAAPIPSRFVPLPVPIVPFPVRRRFDSPFS
jgi:hypothetical protein